MSYPVSKRGIRASRFPILAALLALLLSAASCSRTQKAVTEPAAQKTFTSPDDAGAALVSAARSGDQNALIAIFGPDSKTVLFTGDPATAKAKLQDFVTAYNQMHRWGKIKAGGQVLYVGADNYPFPIPLDQNSSGKWYFDTAAGKDEIQARRIGKNELTAMDASATIAGAQHEYFQETHDGDTTKQYAQKFVSDPGKHDGLYWPVSDGQPQSPLGKLGDFAKALTPTGPMGQPQFNGYSYRILTKGHTAKGVKDYVTNGKMTGGFAILAFPTEYRNTGIMSFLVGDDGTVYQKDLGQKTEEVAGSITEYNPADHWTSASTSANTASRAQQ
jgi:Protein of unknown function (DUF2950)